jgi:hypothetical protein
VRVAPGPLGFCARLNCQFSTEHLGGTSTSFQIYFALASQIPFGVIINAAALRWFPNVPRWPEGTRPAKAAKIVVDA